ncbi:MAG: hypothetical protein KAT56_03615 [Sedimentisphaerales bacterium]|nr:hypothetical protein [Sedimentisphaerales bacterium]
MDKLNPRLRDSGLLAEQIELLQWRMELLEPRDRVLLEAYYRGNLSLRKLGWLCGLSEYAVAQRIEKMSRRLLKKDYITILRYKKGIDSRQRKVAYDHFLLGLGYRTIAAKRNLSYHTTRKTVKSLKQWLSVNDGTKITYKHIKGEKNDNVHTRKDL